MASTGTTKLEIENWLKSYVAKLLDKDGGQVDVHMDLDRFGLNSAEVVSMIGELEDWLKVELSPSLLFEHTTIDAVSTYLHKQIAQR
jgi:acyl carrier protein